MRRLNSRPAEDFQLLMRATESRQTGQWQMSARAKWYFSVLIGSFLLFVACLFAMLNQPIVQSVAHSLGMSRIGNNIPTILELLAYPLLMFAAIAFVYAVQRLVALYKAAHHV